MLQRVMAYFVRGVLLVVPAFAAVYVVWAIVAAIDRAIRGVLRHEIPPGTGFVLTLVMITAVGMLASNVLTRWMVRAVERTFVRLPLVQLIYTSLRDLIDAFVGERKRFDRPVIVAVSDGVHMPGFVTRDDLSALGLAGRVAVYLPQSYNFAGNLVVVPAERVTPLDADSAAVMKFIVSGGVSA